MGNHLEPTTDEHRQVAEMLPAYALQAVSEAERQQVEQHLTTCPHCRSEIAALRHVTLHLALAADERTPPPALRQRLIDAAQSELTAVEPTPITAALSSTRRRWRRPPLSVMAASLLLALCLGLGGWNLTLQRQLADERLQQAALQGQRDDQLRQIAQLQAQIADLQTRPSVLILAARGTSDAPNVTGQLLYVPQQRVAYLSLRNLPTLTAGRTYQVWFIQNGRPVDAGLLPTGPDQAATRLEADLSRYQAIAVSLEPIGGSAQPTGPVLAQAPITLGNI